MKVKINSYISRLNSTNWMLNKAWKQKKPRKLVNWAEYTDKNGRLAQASRCTTYQNRKSSPLLAVVLPTWPNKLELGSQKIRSKHSTTWNTITFTVPILITGTLNDLQHYCQINCSQIQCTHTKVRNKMFYLHVILLKA